MTPPRALVRPLLAQVAARRREADAPIPPWRWLADPRSAVLLLLGSVILLGGGRRLWLAARARRALAQMVESDPGPEVIAEAARHGRGGLIDLFRLLTEAPGTESRVAAGRALAALWARDELIAEEEQAVVRRGFQADWRARRRYPRGIAGPIPIAVEYGLPFLRDRPGEVGPGQLDWSHQVAGAGRSSLESPSNWRPGPAAARFAIDPADYLSNGPFRLVLQARCRSGSGLTSRWEVALPHVPFSFEFDPALELASILATEDADRAVAFEGAVGLEPATETPPPVGVGPDLVLADLPDLTIAAPLPCDLAHDLAIEFEGVDGRFPAGSVVVSGQGGRDGSRPCLLRFAIGPPEGLPAGAFERPGAVRLRAWLTPNAHRGWADPDVRSVWPGTIATPWAEARLLRR